MESSMELPQNTKNRTTIQSNTTIPEHISEGKWASIKKSHFDIHVCCSTNHNSHGLEVAQMPYNWWTASENVVYIPNGVLFSHKEDINCVIFRLMEETREHHVKWSKPDSKVQRSHVFPHIHVCIYVYVHVCVYIYVHRKSYIHKYIHICVGIYTNICGKKEKLIVLVGLPEETKEWKTGLFQRWHPCEQWEHKEWARRVNMVDEFCIHVLK
jgi:hypothetical protein